MFEELRVWDCDYFWYLFMVMSEYFELELVIICFGVGICLFDIDGKFYFDGCFLVWFNLYGYNYFFIN